MFNSKTVENYDPSQKRNKLGQWTKNDAAIQQKKDNLQPIEVNKDNIPSFASKKDLGDWFSSIFEDLGSVKISDTGIEVDLYKSNAEREASKRRLQQEPNKAVGVKFSEMVEKSIKIDERPKDERHKHDQEQYYNKLKLGEDLYDVDIFIDYLEPNNEYRYAGHKTKQIDNEISVRDTQVINHIMLTKTDKKSTRDLQPIKIKVMHTKVDASIIPDNSNDFNPKGEKMLNKVENENPLLPVTCI